MHTGVRGLKCDRRANMPGSVPLKWRFEGAALDGNSVTSGRRDHEGSRMNTEAVQTGTRYPSRSEVASAHGRSTNCWACGSADAVGLAASADWGGGFATDPKEYGLLCDNCYLKAPQLGTAEVFWSWLSRDRSAAGPARSTMKSMVDELGSLPAEEREAVLIHGVALERVSRGLSG